jgi:thiol-disulfide isomerase/thioredoxin
MVTPEVLKRSFDAGLSYDAYVATGSPDQQGNWKRSQDRMPSLTDSQRSLLGSFTRQMNILVISGTWCGDCVQQCPMFPAFASAAGGKINLKFVDRDKHIDLAEQVKICGGHRVPTVLFLNEDFDFVSVLGDRTLTRYRVMAAKSLGASCPLPGAPVPADELAATQQDWLNEFERVQLILRLSAKLRQKHGD